jgi:predicted DNA-binding protein
MAKKKTDKKDRHLPYKLVRIPDELYEKLKAVSEKNHRPVAWEVRLALEMHVQTQEEKTEGG